MADQVSRKRVIVEYFRAAMQSVQVNTEQSHLKTTALPMSGTKLRQKLYLQQHRIGDQIPINVSISASEGVFW